MINFIDATNDVTNYVESLMHLLRNCVQVWHWRQIFHGLGREYDPAKHYKVQDLINLHLSVYSQLIDGVLASAVEAYGVEQRFNKIRSFWEEREFKLAKHVLDSTQESGQNVNSLLFVNSYISIKYLRFLLPCYASFWYVCQCLGMRQYA